MSSNSQLSLTPLGAGDLIDRAVRFYRKNFWTFIWIAAPPVLVGTLISVGWTMLGRSIFSVNSYNSPEVVGYYLFTWFGGIMIWLIETVAVLTVMGGASRNFVRHLLFGEPITFRETYKNTRQRVFGLMGASLIITSMIWIIGGIIFYFGILIIAIAVMIIAGLFAFSPFLTFVFSIILGLPILIGTGWVFFLIASRFAYVPQVMLVEGQSVVSALGRSVQLASGNVKRFAALFIFTTVVTYSALALLYIPLGWYAWASGIEVFYNADMAPAWYEIANQLVGQISFILLMPIWMIGLCLLYVDERVRHEGYDIELMAARRLGEIPDVPQAYVNPLQPALSNETKIMPAPTQNQSSRANSKMTTLDLN
jgi:hypothetical protein